MLYPFIFKPIFQPRIWGGRSLERLYHKALPPDVAIGESWEISDRPEAVSVIANGPLAGRDLRWLMENHRDALLGSVSAPPGRFPLLVKILDAQQATSLQVHPPAGAAAKFGGEPKTELWYVAEAGPQAELWVGLKRGVAREEFERRIQDGSVQDCLHRAPVQAGDAMFLPSGRLHGLGADTVIFEIQENSDTTYRVFDWNRPGADGKPRKLHIPEAMESIDFNDIEPLPITNKFSRSPSIAVQYVLQDPLFTVDACRVRRGQRFYLRLTAPLILGVVAGRLEASYQSHEVRLEAGQFCLLPASLDRVALQADRQVTYLNIQPH